MSAEKKMRVTLTLFMVVMFALVSAVILTRGESVYALCKKQEAVAYETCVLEATR